jgi:hypothetical protein
MTQTFTPAQGTVTASRMASPLVITGEAPLLDGALRLAEAVCRRDRVNAYIVGMVRPLPASLQLPPELASELERGELDECRRIQTQARLSARVREAVGLSSFFTTTAELGAPETMIPEVVRLRGADYVLTGVAPAGAASRSDGVEAAAVMADRAGVPVVAAPPETALVPRTAVACIDLTEPSLRAAAATLPLLGEEGSLTLVHVIPSLAGPSEAAVAWIEAGVRTAEQRLPRLAAELAWVGGIRTDALVLRGEPAEVLAEHLAGVDLVALGTPRRSRRTAGGSVWEAATDLARGSLLLAPREARPRSG